MSETVTPPKLIRPRFRATLAAWLRKGLALLAVKSRETLKGVFTARADRSGARIAQLAVIIGLAYLGVGGKLVLLSRETPQTLKGVADNPGTAEEG